MPESFSADVVFCDACCIFEYDSYAISIKRCASSIASVTGVPGSTSRLDTDPGSAISSDSVASAVHTRVAADLVSMFKDSTLAVPAAVEVSALCLVDLEVEVSI